MHKLIFYLFLLFFISCSKDDGVQDETIDQTQSSNIATDTTDVFNFVNLEEYISSGRSGTRLKIYGRYTNTSTNYLLAQEPEYVPTEKAYNTDSLQSTIYKRHDPEIVNIGGVFCGIWSITHVYKDGTQENDIFFARDTSINYFVINTYNQNLAKFSHNYLIIQREFVPMMSYYDFDWKKYKLKARYRISSASTSDRDYIASKLNNSNIFRLQVA